VSLPTLTIVVPTIGRLPGLQHTLDSIARQALVPGDRVLVVLDTYQEPPKPHIRALVATYGFEYHEHDGGTHFFGNPQLNHAMTVATADPATTTDFFCALGDDDVYVDGALARIRWQLKPGWVGLVQFYSPPFPTPDGPRRLVLWDDRVLKQAHISGCCLIAPTASLVPVKAERRIEVDFDWIQDVVAKTGHGPLWIDDCVILARPRLVDGHPVRTLAAMRSGLKLLVVHPGASWSTKRACGTAWKRTASPSSGIGSTSGSTARGRGCIRPGGARKKRTPRSRSPRPPTSSTTRGLASSKWRSGIRSTPSWSSAPCFSIPT
jgi:hypothetical protein